MTALAAIRDAPGLESYLDELEERLQETVDDLVDFIVARCLDQLGLEHALTRRWGQP